MRGPREYLKPSTVAEALRLREATPDARFIAGGTDLWVRMRQHHGCETPLAFVSLRSVRELSGLDLGDPLRGDPVRIGAMVTLSDLALSAPLRGRFPALVGAALAMGSVQIRNVATVGGNLCNASPAADLAPALLAYDARVEIRSVAGRRETPLADLFLAPGRTSLQPGELLAAVLLPSQGLFAKAAFLRRGRVRMDLALASVAVRLEEDAGVLKGVRVAVGAVAPTPRRLPEVEAILEGRRPEPALFAEAGRAAAARVAPITDLRASERYRRHLVGVLVRRAFERLCNEGVHAS